MVRQSINQPMVRLIAKERAEDKPAEDCTVARVIANWGDEKTGKTTFALTAPKPIFHCDFDLGIERVLYRFKGEAIESVPYAIPIQLSKRITGVKEVWKKLVEDYTDVLQDKRKYEDKTPFQTIVFDTGTQQYEICRLGFLQERQETKPDKQTLDPIEYAEPYARMKSMIYGARQYKKNLIITHYSADEYAPKLIDSQLKDVKTGKTRMDGFRLTEGLVDTVLYNYRVDADPYAKPNPTLTTMHGIVTLSGLHIRLAGIRFEDPTFTKLEEALAMLFGE